MKNIKITNKKTFASFILFVLMLIGVLFFLVFKIMEFKRDSYDIQRSNQQNITRERIDQEDDKGTLTGSEMQNLQENQK